jgi:hypothetical protein
MDYKIYLDEETNKLENFQILLEKYKNYKSVLREIKINTLLGQKCVFEIEEMNPPILCDLCDFNTTKLDISLSNVAVMLNKLSFTINSNLLIEELKLNYRILDTKMGKLIGELQTYGVEVEIKAKVLTYGWNNSKQVSGFYIQTTSLSTYIRA